MLSNNNKKLSKSNKFTFVNVKTNRQIKKLDNPKISYYKINNHYICGSDEDIDEFITSNTISKSSLEPIYYKGSEKNSDTSSIKSFLEEEDSPKLKIPEINNYNESLTKSNNQEEITEEKKFYCPKNNDVKDLNDDNVNELNVFSLDDMSSKIRISKVLSSGIFEFVINISVIDFFNSCKIYSKSSNADFFIKLQGSFYGLHMANENTKETKLGVELITRYFKKLNNIVYVKIHENLELEMFSDKNKKCSINKLLSDIKIEEYGGHKIFSESEIEYEEVDVQVDMELVNKYEIDKDV